MDRHEFVQDAAKKAQESVAAEAAAKAAQESAEDPGQQAPDLSAIKAQVGARYVIPEAMRDRLHGSNAEEIEADARKISEHFRANLRTMPTPLVKGGGAAEYYPGSSGFDPIALAKKILARRYAD